jgi:hypothetical protein
MLVEGREAKLSSNLRTLSSAMHLYAADHDGFFPCGYDDVTGDRHWHHALSRYLNGSNAYPVDSKSIFHDPLDTATYAYDVYARFSSPNIAMNGYVEWTANEARPANAVGICNRRLASIEQPAKLSPFEFLDRLTDLIPQPRKHRHRYHGVFAPNHPLRSAVTALAVGNVGKRRDAATGGHADGRHAAEGCCNSHDKPRSHDTSRIAWAKLMARVGEEFPLLCPACGGDIRLISFITEPGPIRKILTHLGEPLEPPPISPARGPPTDWGELVQVHDDRDVFQASPDELPAIDIHSL